MFTRISSAALTLLLAGCYEAGDPKADDPIESRTIGPLNCKVDGSRRFEEVCRIRFDDNDVWTFVAPSGGIRRLRLTEGAGPLGLTATAVDGAEPATISKLADGGVEISVSGDAYRFPAELLK